MKIQIETIPEKPRYTSTFLLKVHLIDSIEHGIIIMPYTIKTEEKLIEMAKQIEEMISVNSIEEYYGLPYWDKWESDLYGVSFSSDPAKVTGYKIFWYDEHGLEYKVQVIKDNQ